MTEQTSSRFQVTLHRAIPFGDPMDLEAAVQTVLNLLHNGYTSVQIRTERHALVWSNAGGKPLPTTAEAEQIIRTSEAWPACEFDDCNEPSTAGSEFCPEHRAEHAANMRRERYATVMASDLATCDCGRGNPMLQGNGAPDICQECLDEGRGIYPNTLEDAPEEIEADDHYQRLDNSLVDCLVSIGQQASQALEIDRSDADAVERLSSYLDAISRLQRHADRLLKEIAELS